MSYNWKVNEENVKQILKYIATKNLMETNNLSRAAYTVTENLGVSVKKYERD